MKFLAAITFPDSPDSPSAKRRRRKTSLTEPELFFLDPVSKGMEPLDAYSQAVMAAADKVGPRRGQPSSQLRP